MKGMILAAGLGTRLRPLTLERPKAAVPVANQPAALRAGRALSRAGIKEVAVNLHHLPDGVRTVLGDGSELGVTITYSPETDGILGTGGGMRRALELIGPDTLVVVNGDVVCDLDLGLLVRHHEKSGAPVTLALVAHPEVERYGSVTLAGGRVTSIAGRCGPGGVGAEARDTVFTGIHVMDPEAQALLPREGCVVRTTFFSMLERGMEIAGYLHEGSWSDVGTPAEYLRCNLELAGGRLVGENVTVGDARLGPDVVLGDGAVVEDGADLSSCVVWDGATARGRLHHAIVGREHVVRIGEVS